MLDLARNGGVPQERSLCVGREVPRDLGDEVPVPLNPFILDALPLWRAESHYKAEKDFLFASIRLSGAKPLSPDVY
jgi:hypothetical protein